MTEPSAIVIADSLSPRGQRLTTIQVTHHRFVLAEINTHRVFSRNSASSRAIPIQKQIDRVKTDPAMPVRYERNQAGMKSSTLIGDPLDKACEAIILKLRDEAVLAAEALADFGLHKQWVNRYLEPWMWHTVIITSTEWDNFLRQRNSLDAQPELQEAAAKIASALNLSYPKEVKYGGLHLPYISDEERKIIAPREMVKVSAARCARVSYLTHDGTRDIMKDLELYRKLSIAHPPHWSPLEHVAAPYRPHKVRRWKRPLGNFDGWAQLRHNTYGPDYTALDRRYLR